MNASLGNNRLKATLGLLTGRQREIYSQGTSKGRTDHAHASGLNVLFVQPEACQRIELPSDDYRRVQCARVSPSASTRDRIGCSPQELTQI